jgi:CheY-like chemotaxis protein
VLLKQCKAVFGKKGERLPHDSGLWFHTFFVRYYTIFVWCHTVRSCGSMDRILPGIRLEFREMKLLVVGSNPLMRRMVLNVVADLAPDIRECTTAEEAIAAYAGYSPDFVIADADGMQAAPRIRDAYPEARVIVLGDYDDPDLRAQAFQAGASRYVLKDDMFSLIGLIQSLA